MAFRKIQVSNLQSTESAVKDPLLILNQDSSEDVDSGFLAKRGVSTYSGLVRDSATAKFYLIESINLVTNSLNDISAVDGTLSKGILELNSLNATTIYVTGASGAIHTTNLVTENIGYWPADPTDTTKHILTVGDATTPAEYIGNVTGNVTGNVVGNIEGNIINSLGQPVVDNSGALNPTRFKVPKGLTSERPTPAAEGDMWFNTETKMFEGYDGTAWQQLVPSQFQSTP